jgi:hypothetical protein
MFGVRTKQLSIVLRGLDPRIHVFAFGRRKAWMAGPSPAKTTFAWFDMRRKPIGVQADFTRTALRASGDLRALRLRGGRPFFKVALLAKKTSQFESLGHPIDVASTTDAIDDGDQRPLMEVAANGEGFAKAGGRGQPRGLDDDPRETRHRAAPVDEQTAQSFLQIGMHVAA